MPQRIKCGNSHTLSSFDIDLIYLMRLSDDKGDIDYIREGDLSSHMNLMQVQQNDIMKQVIIRVTRLIGRYLRCRSRWVPL